MRVAVVGAGMAGLSAALDLREAGVDVVVLEGADRVGGKLALGDVGGVRVDLGAEAMLARRPEAVDLARRVGLGEDLTHPETVAAAVWTHGAIRPLPPTVMGVPSDLDALQRSGIVTQRPVGRRLDMPQQDVSVAEFLVPRVGQDVVDRLVEPLLGGVYAGHADRLSLEAAAAQVAALGADPLAAAARATDAPTRTDPVFAGIVGGVGRLPQAVVDAGGLDVRVGATVRSVARDADGWEVHHGPTTDVSTERVDAVVLATPAPATARLLGDVAPQAAFALAGVEYASMAIVTLLLDGPVPSEASGFLVPPVDGTTIKGATFSSVKWGWLAERLDGRSIVRASIGRAGQSTILLGSDESVVDLAVADLRAALGSLPGVVASHVQRWGGGLPQYEVGHTALVETVDRCVAGVPGLEVCGAAYRGIGIPAVIASGQEAALRTLQDAALGG
ncbi:protoporphyrinogen/coproporphyrinogen oxidase [Aeromicrobium sp. CTD01-1L150]|uniref:protoporphyrinogen/coproporphyrinogen oxidase n=1 Tax=Aeromicrobium sp. CTD01-1L150 TaxID=3341830 RepID=UPI0035BFC2FA